MPLMTPFATLWGRFLVRKCVVPDKKDENVVDFDKARSRLEPERREERKEQAARELRQQFQKAMGWNSWPRTKKKKGGKGPKGKGKKK